MQNAWATVKFLTFGGSADPLYAERVGRGAPYFIFVGLAFGVVLALCNRILEPRLESEILGVVLVTVLIILSRAAHLEQTRKIFEAGGPSTPVTVYGFVAVMLLVLLKIRSVEVIGELRNVALLLTPALARWTVVIFLYRSTSVTDEVAWRIARNVKAWHLLSTTIVVLGITIFLVGSRGLWMGLCLSLLAAIFRSFVHHFAKDFTCNHLGALIEMSESLSFVLFASL